MNMAVPPFEKPVISPVLVGRARDMETLERALDAAQRGIGQCIVIAGDAGVGKSRLLSDIRHRAGAERFLTLQGYCFEQDLSFPYAPLVDALRTHLAQRTPPEIRATLGPLTSEIAKLVPELALVLPDLQPTLALDAEAEKCRLFESLTQFFIRLAAVNRSFLSSKTCIGATKSAWISCTCLPAASRHSPFSSLQATVAKKYRPI